jgi:UDPglucose--hexose-1-phosphate uridylyltransferase
MAEIRWDLIKNNWVAIATNMALRPQDFPINKWGIETTGNAIFCPFCEGHEEATPPEIMAIRNNDSEADTAGWSVRVIPNKFSMFNLDGILEKKNPGIYSNYNGLGRQEVLIETPLHGVELHDYGQERIIMIIKVLKQRYIDLSQDDRIKYIQIYKNRGIFAGASQAHSHSQVMGLPFAPQENSGLIDYYHKTGSCLLCDIITQEKLARERLVYETEHFLLICPYASRFPYETWVIPKQHCEHFGAINEGEIKELAMICKKYTRAMIECLQNPAYNYMLNTAPVNVPYIPGFHWYLEITPRLLVTAGVDIATGIYMNPVAPELSAELLRENILGQIDEVIE